MSLPSEAVTKNLDNVNNLFVSKLLLWVDEYESGIDAFAFEDSLTIGIRGILRNIEHKFGIACFVDDILCLDMNDSEILTLLKRRSLKLLRINLTSFVAKASTFMTEESGIGRNVHVTSANDFDRALDQLPPDLANFVRLKKIEVPKAGGENE